MGLTITDLITGEVGQYCLNIRGTNGSGKTTLMRSLIEADGEATEIFVPGIKKAAFTYCPSFNTLIIGSYRNVCGGCDNLVKYQIVRLMKIAWVTCADVWYEGVLLHTKEPYYWYMRELCQELARRVFGFVYLDLPVSECIRRVYARNGGKSVKEDLIHNKVKALTTAKEWHKQQKDALVMSVDATNKPRHVLGAILTNLSSLEKILQSN